MGSAPSPGADTGGPGFGGGAGSTSTTPNATPQDLTPEQQVILIEAQRAKYQEQGSPMANLLPPTPLTQQLQGDAGGPPVP